MKNSMYKYFFITALMFLNSFYCLSMEVAPDDILLKAASEGKVIEAQAALTNGANPNGLSKHIYSPLYGAARAGHLELVKLLIASGADINWRRKGSRKEPLYAAAAHPDPHLASLAGGGSRRA